MDDACTRLAAQEILSEQTDQVVTLDECPGFVKEEAAVEVTVPGQPDVGAVTSYRIGGALAVLLDHRIGHPIRERAIGIVVNLDELEWQMRFKLINDETCASI